MSVKNSARNSGKLSHIQVQTIEDFLPMFAATFDASLDNIAVYSNAGMLVYANPAILAMLHINEANVAIKDLPTTKLFLEALKVTLQTEAPHSILLDFEHAELKRRVYDIVHFSPMKDIDNNLIGIFTVGRDFNYLEQEKNAETKRQEHYLRALLDTFPFMVWMKDKQNRFLATNAMFAETAAVATHLELRGKTDFDFFPEEMAQGYVADDIEVLKTGKAKTVLEKIQKKNGEYYWAETFKSPVEIDGQVIGTVGFARDISERNNLLTEIAKKELEYASLVNNLPLSMVRYDLNCRRVFVNASTRDFLSDDIESLLGKTPLEAWNPHITNMTAEQFQDNLMQVMQSGMAQKFEIHCKTQDVTYVNMLNLLPEFNEKNQVVGALALVNDITEMSQYRQRLEHLAYHDPLTALPNRTLLNEHMQLAIKYAAEHENGFGLLFIDLDFFKAINDTLGHAVGDALLVEAAKRILASVRSNDVVSRIGGDEFAILVMDVNEDYDLAGLAAKIVAKLAEPFVIEEISFFVTASIGIACCPTDSDNINDLMKYADTAMYHAKKQGRNNFQFYTTELTQTAMEHLAIATALRYAIKKKELFLHYQPKVCIESRKVLGAEALLRWNSKVLGDIVPDKFVPIAEESGLIIEIGDWVLQQACKDAVQINKVRKKPLVIAVNISSKQFIGNNFIAHLEHCLHETGCDAKWLALEITESLLLQDSDEVLQTLTAIDGMGITIAIDDFGTGYSALAYLNKFPISQVKIDRSFVNDICNNQSAALLVKAIIAMAQSLNKGLVAEGIETREQASLIKDYGCNEAQGYLYSKPVPLSEFTQLFR